MALGKRTLHVSKSELEKLFGLPESAEIMAVRPSGLGGQHGYEFLIVSEGVIEGLTLEQYENGSDIRKITLNNELLTSNKNKSAREIVNDILRDLEKMSARAEGNIE